MYNNSIKKFFKATLLFTVLFTIFACSNAVNGIDGGGVRNSCQFKFNFQCK